MRKLFDKSILNNNRGSILSTAIIVVTILTFSLTSITVLTVNLASNTSTHLALTTEENEAKAYIIEAENQFEAFIRATDSIDNFNNTEIDRIKTELNVDVVDLTNIKAGFGTATNGSETYAYSFSVTLSTGRIVYNEIYVSTFGTSVQTFNPFEFALATDGDLILNGGLYDNVKLYGKSIMISDYPYFYDELYEDWRVLDGEYPLYSFNNSLTEIYSEDYRYCDDGCWSFVSSDPDEYIIMNDSSPSIYEDVEGSALSDKGIEGDMIISDFFTSFDFDTYLFDFIVNLAPTNDRVLPEDPATLDYLTLKDLIWDNYADDYYFDDVSNANYNRNRTFRDSSVYNGNLIVSHNLTIQNDTDALIVLGDMTIDSSENNTMIDGMFIILGDLIINGDSLDIEGSFFVQGETIINMNDDEGIATNGNNYGLTLLSKDNIRFERMFVNEGLSSPENLPNISAFMYTEQSVYIDALHSIFQYEGSIFAEAKGGSINPIHLMDEAHVQVNGIVVQSYTGYLYQYNTWWQSYYYAVPSNDEDNTRFQITSIDHNNYLQTFLNIPDFESVVSSEGFWTFQASEFGYSN